MDKVKSGLAFHVHLLTFSNNLPQYDTLFEFCHDYDERVRFIKQNKPIEERELRLRLFQLIPEDKLPRGTKAYDKAGKAYYKAREAYDKAEEACDKAREDCNKAWETYFRANKEALEKLHSELCPNCPWDGKSIFKVK